MRLKAHASDIGWGYADYLHQEVRFLEDELSRFTNYDGLLLADTTGTSARMVRGPSRNGLATSAVSDRTQDRLNLQKGQPALRLD